MESVVEYIKPNIWPIIMSFIKGEQRVRSIPRVFQHDTERKNK